MAVSIISLYTLFRLDEKMRVRDALIHGAVTGYLIAIRPLGLLMLAMTGMLLLIKMVLPGKISSHPDRQIMVTLSLYLAITVSLVLLFWPWLWLNPVGNFISAFQTMSQYTTWRGRVLYLGSLFEPTQLPWHYTLVWIAVTTPLVYSFLFLAGIFMFARDIINRKFRPVELNDRFDLIMLVWFTIPLITVVIMHSVLYSGWRHLFFIYPVMLALAIRGILALDQVLRTSFSSRFPQMLLRSIVILSLFGTTLSMIVNHPYEDLYFTILAGKNLKSGQVPLWAGSVRPMREGSSFTCN
ncbi:MAG: hypothetical protein MZV65_42080 [Chromatiales bacterium]|nr:hypothetical protein [Chromatiales bacterium]